MRRLRRARESTREATAGTVGWGGAAGTRGHRGGMVMGEEGGGRTHITSTRSPEIHSQISLRNLGLRIYEATRISEHRLSIPSLPHKEAISIYANVSLYTL